MKVAIGHKIQTGPYGGGNAFVVNLAQALRDGGHHVTFDLRDDDLDIILLTDPRPRSPNVSFSAGAIMRCRAFRNGNAVVVHRINECDERKNTKTMNRRLRIANHCADHTVLVGSWLRGLDLFDGRPEDDAVSVILNGADSAVYNSTGYRPWDGSGPLCLVTHHWGGNWMKGFDVYAKLDAMLAAPAWRDRIGFTYIGNLPPGFRFENAQYREPLGGPAIAEELHRHHVYITASINEPGGNHQVEGGQCGLPLLYRNSGCLPEYCDGYGIAFDDTAVEPALEAMIADYAAYAERMKTFPLSAAKTAGQYVALFERLLADREPIIARRRRKRRLAGLLAAQIWI